MENWQVFIPGFNSIYRAYPIKYMVVSVGARVVGISCAVDIGYRYFVIFILVTALVKDWWEYSDVNNLKKFHSIKGNQTTEIELQKENAYIINFNWRRNKNKPDIMHTTDIGTYKKSGRDSFQLYSHAGSSRVLENIGGKFVCKDRESEGDRNLDGYEFT